MNDTPVIAKQLANQECWRGGALLAFDADGACLGAIKRSGREDRYSQPEPLTDAERAACAQVGWVAEPQAPPEHPSSPPAKRRPGRPRKVLVVAPAEDTQPAPSSEDEPLPAEVAVQLPE